MRHFNWLKLLVLLFVIPFFTVVHFAQNAPNNPVDITVVSEDDLTPSIIKGLPDWQNNKDKATQIKNSAELKKLLGNNKILDLIEFTGGTEAVTANYEAGKLLVVEFQTPQFSVDADTKIQQFLAENQSNPPIFYRRVGNYSAFIFEGKDEASANALLDQVKYEKVVQWLGEDPNYLQKAERYFIRQTSQLFFSTVIAIVGGISIAVLLGIVVGFLYFRSRNQRLNQTAAFSDAGGMTRLNLDGLSAPDSTQLLSE